MCRRSPCRVQSLKQLLTRYILIVVEQGVTFLLLPSKSPPVMASMALQDPGVRF